MRAYPSKFHTYFRNIICGYVAIIIIIIISITINMMVWPEDFNYLICETLWDCFAVVINDDNVPDKIH